MGVILTVEENKLFRKTALDKISSPEQLNEYMKVAGPGVWAILAGLAITFAAFLTWGLTGSIPETVEITGTTVKFEGDDYSYMFVYSYLPVEYNKLLVEGMQVRVSPNYAPREKYGYIYGEIIHESDSAVDIEQLKISMSTDFHLLDIPDGNVIEVIIMLETTSDGRLHWSTFLGDSVDVISGSTCHVSVITNERRPIELMFR